MGGKWTIFRLMGEEAMDQIVSSYGLNAVYNSRSKDLKLIGSEKPKSHIVRTLK